MSTIFAFVARSNISLLILTIHSNVLLAVRLGGLNARKIFRYKSTIRSYKTGARLWCDAEDVPAVMWIRQDRQTIPRGIMWHVPSNISLCAAAYMVKSATEFSGVPCKVWEITFHLLGMVSHPVRSVYAQDFCTSNMNVCEPTDENQDTWKFLPFYCTLSRKLPSALSCTSPWTLPECMLLQTFLLWHWWSKPTWTAGHWDSQRQNHHNCWNWFCVDALEWMPQLQRWQSASWTYRNKCDWGAWVENISYFCLQMFRDTNNCLLVYWYRLPRIYMLQMPLMYSKTTSIVTKSAIVKLNTHKTHLRSFCLPQCCHMMLSVIKTSWAGICC